MKRRFFLLMFLIPTVCFSQNGDIYSFFDNKNSIDFKKMEVPVSDNLKRQYANNLKPHFKELFITPWNNTPYPMSKFIPCLHFLNLNGDQYPDVIYYGYSGGESNCVGLFLNEGGRFKKIGLEDGYLQQIGFDQKHKLNSFTIMDFGCCGEYIETQTRYRVDEGYTAIVEFKRSIVMDTEKPMNRFKNPVRFKTLNEGYTLRSTTIIDNKPGSINGDDRKGNIVSVYPQFSYGTAWAEKQDSTGRIWWFVEMDPVNNLKDNIIYTSDWKKTKHVGWISSRYVEEIEENK
jgi:hypothetical protein